jgi:hypothetical protein
VAIAKPPAKPASAAPPATAGPFAFCAAVPSAFPVVFAPLATVSLALVAPLLSVALTASTRPPPLRPLFAGPRLVGERLREEEEPLRAEERLFAGELLLAVGRLALDARVFGDERLAADERLLEEFAFPGDVDLTWAILSPPF